MVCCSDDHYHTPSIIKESLRVTSRVAGFACLHILNGHSGCVSGLVLAETDNHVYLVGGAYYIHVKLCNHDVMCISRFQQVGIW